MNILEQVEAALRNFHPRNQREVAVLQIARRFNDLSNLAQYLLAATRHSKPELIAAAALARETSDVMQRPARFFEALAAVRREAA